MKSFDMKSTNLNSFDVIITGAGIVGLALACALDKLNLRVALVESDPIDSTLALSLMPGTRVSAINAASRILLDYLGVWQQILALRSTPYQSIEVRDQDGFGQIRFEAGLAENGTLGHIIENDVIRQVLWQRLQTSEQVKIFAPLNTQQILFGENECFLQLDNGQMLSAKLAIAADGAESWLRRQANVPLTFWDYPHHALVATITTELPHQNSARQIFHADGVLAFLPLWQQNLCSIVWSLPPDAAHRLQQASAEDFQRELAARFDMQAGLCHLASERRVFPLMARYAHDFAGHRLALVGDAAHTLHPLAGQGMNLGLLDVALLSSELERLSNTGKDFGQHRYLRRYERQAKHNAATMLAAMQGFNLLFSGSQPWKKGLRNLGLAVIDRMPDMKLRLMRRAMGLDLLPPFLQQSTINHQIVTTENIGRKNGTTNSIV